MEAVQMYVLLKKKRLLWFRCHTQYDEAANWDYSMTLSKKENPLSKATVKGSQFVQPLLEFSGACAGCGETPYAKLNHTAYSVTECTLLMQQVVHQSGVVQAPSTPYTTNDKGHGPAWANSLFEDNAEFGLRYVL